MYWKRESIYLFLVAFIIAGITLSGAQEHAWAVEDTVDVYFGNPDNYTKPASISVLTVLLSHPSYQLIQEKKLDQDQAEYWILMNKINEDINWALEEISRGSGYDLIVETGSIKAADKISAPDITAKVIALIKKRMANEPA